MSILDNAVSSIQIGMEDFHNDGDPRRVLSAIRNLYAGILLLFKYKLQQLSPDDSDEVLLKTRVRPKINPVSEGIEWVGKGKKTVDTNAIIDRLDSLGVTGVDWELLNKLQEIRNDIEHYFSKQPASEMNKAISNALQLIIQFCEPHLNKKPVEILGEECWEQMLDIASIYDEQLKACHENLNAVDWPFDEVKSSIPEMRCPDCKSELLEVIDTNAKEHLITFSCRVCQNQSDYASVIGPSVFNSMTTKNCRSYKEGGYPETFECPECNEDSFLTSQLTCAACFYEPSYTRCRYCSVPFDLDAMLVGDSGENGICGYCRYKMNKDD